MKRKLLIQLFLLILLFGFTGTLYALPSEIYLRTIGVSPGSAGSFHFGKLGNVNVLYGEYDLEVDWDKEGPGSYESISGFCVEDAWATSSYGVTYGLFLPSALGQNYVYAAYILSQYQANQISAQAAQIATWETVLDFGDLNLYDGGNFYVNSTDPVTSAYTSEAFSFLSEIYTNGIGNFTGDNFRIARNPVMSDPGSAFQDYVIAVPDASILFLLGSAFLALSLLGRKKSKVYL